ncbi:MAG: hypothetical protein COB53_08400 [Elusimicrobia bacterium]|nr:MAG: hypothetical protein COB53_08400 [Elusimicrobiota bacterium]
MKHFLLSRLSRITLAGTFLLVGCSPPKYIGYRSEAGDFFAQVPYGWSVYLDRQGDDYLAYNFIGPFEPEFFRGVPSLSVRWYKAGAKHRLRLGLSESYYSGNDYIRKVLREVYGSDRFMKVDVHDISISGWSGKHFVVISPTDVERKTQFGVSNERGGKRRVVLRQHEYAVLPMDSGFYVFIYPATTGGFSKYADRFNHLVNTFKVLKDGPGGPLIKG